MLIYKTIIVGDIKIEPDPSLAIRTWLVLYDNLELAIVKESLNNSSKEIYPPIKTNNTKTIWQKAQQQYDEFYNDKRYQKPFEDDGAYAD